MSTQEKEYLELFKKQSEAMLGWGNSEDWSNADFEKLSELVFEKTGVNLSISTLKRVWGKVRYDSAPTTTTLNTLVQFSGYKSWRDFCSQAEKEKEPKEVVVESSQKAPTPIVPPKTKKPLRWAVAAVLTMLLMVLVFVWLGSSNPAAVVIDRSKIIFTSHIVSDELPNSVVFDYNIGKVKTDNVIIQQSWDPKRRENVAPNQHQHTSIYYYPGFFKAKLLVDGKIVSEHEVFVKTNGWKGFIDDQPQARPFYLSDREIKDENGMMHTTAKMLTDKTGKTVFNDIYSVFSDVHEYPVNPDSFIFNATLQNTSPKEQAICQQAKVTLITSDGFIAIPLCAKGCTADIFVNVADSGINGKDHDLSVFGCDFSKPHNLQLNIKDKKGIIYLDEKPIFTIPYNKPLGRIVGITFVFEGTGEVKNFGIK